MSNLIINKQLEEIAISLRETLEIDSNAVISKYDFDMIVDKIKKNFENTKIQTVRDGCLLVINDKSQFVIYLSINDNLEEQFYSLIRFFTYAIIFDKKTLNTHEQKNHYISYSKILNDKYASYLALAFLMPQELFYSTWIKYSRNDGTVDIFAMEKELKNKYVYRRGLDLGYWIV